MRDCLLADAVDPGAVFALGARDGQAHFLGDGAGDEAPDAVRFMPMSA